MSMKNFLQKIELWNNPPENISFPFPSVKHHEEDYSQEMFLLENFHIVDVKIW